MKPPPKKTIQTTLSAMKRRVDKLESHLHQVTVCLNSLASEIAPILKDVHTALKEDANPDEEQWKMASLSDEDADADAQTNDTPVDKQASLDRVYDIVINLGLLQQALERLINGDDSPPEQKA